MGAFEPLPEALPALTAKDQSSMWERWTRCLRV